MGERLFINGRFLVQHFSGVQRYAYELTSALDAAPELKSGQIEVEVLVPPGLKQEPAWNHVALRRVGRLSGHAWEQIELPRFARAGLLVNFGGSAPLWHRQSVVAMHDAAVFEHPENFSWSYRTLHQTLRPRLARQAWKLLTVSAFSRRELARHCKVPEARFVIIGDSAEHILRVEGEADVLMRFGLEKGRFILCVGNHAPNKNLSLAANAFLDADLPGYRLVIVGGDAGGVFGKSGGPNSEDVVFTGRISDGALRTLYENARLFLFPSKYEGFGVPPLEAMTLGCPVLSSDAPAMKEVLGAHAAYFRNDDRESLIEALVGAVKRAESDGVWPIESAKTHALTYSWRRNARELLDLVTEQSHAAAA